MSDNNRVTEDCRECNQLMLNGKCFLETKDINCPKDFLANNINKVSNAQSSAT